MYDIPYVSDAIRIFILVMLGLGVFFLPGLDDAIRLIVIALFLLLIGVVVTYRRRIAESDAS